MSTEDVGLDEVRPEPHYKVERQLRDGFPRARKQQPSGVSVDLRIYFRENRDGTLWGGVGMYDESGDRIEYMALDSKEGLQWLLRDVLCDVGFEAAPRERTKPRTTYGMTAVRRAEARSPHAPAGASQPGSSIWTSSGSPVDMQSTMLIARANGCRTRRELR
jgi:hypothetical protein